MQDATLSVDGQSATFVYVDGTEGWINVTDAETQTSVAGAIPYVTATVSGACNTLTTVCTNYKVAYFVQVQEHFVYRPEEMLHLVVLQDQI